MNKYAKHIGQISLAALIGIGASFVLAGLGGYFTQLKETRGTIREAEVRVQKNETKIATLEEAVKTIKDDSVEIKRDIKQILKLLK